jgi:hypothetical protein
MQGRALRSRSRGRTVTEQERAEVFLQERSGLFFCAVCLGRELDIPVTNGRDLLWTLRSRPGYEMRGGKCLGCGRGERLIGHVRGVFVPGLTGEIVAFLLANRDISVCDACVAFATECSLTEVRHVLDTLRPFAEFRRSDGVCMVCIGTKKVTATTVDSGGPLVPDKLLYRGWRLDVLSYRICSGKWRPLVLVKRPSESLTPEAAGLPWQPCSSKEEADRYAVRAGREWVDKHS